MIFIINDDKKGFLKMKSKLLGMFDEMICSNESEKSIDKDLLCYSNHLNQLSFNFNVNPDWIFVLIEG